MKVSRVQSTTGMTWISPAASGQQVPSYEMSISHHQNQQIRCTMRIIELGLLLES